MRRVFFLFILSSFTIPLLAQKSYEEIEEEWRNDPLRFLIAENRQTIVWTDIGDGNPKRSEKQPIDGKVIIGVDSKVNITILSEDGTIFHTHKFIMNSNGPAGVVSKGKDEIGEFVDIKYDCEMFFSDFGNKEEYFGPTSIIYRLYTSGVFILKEYSEKKLSNIMKMTILTNYVGTYKMEQTREIMKLTI